MTSISRLKVGFLGAGYILHAHAEAVHAAGAQPFAVCDVSHARARAAAATFGIPHAVSSLQELLDAGCDAIHVLLPPQLHADAVRQILLAGRHVLVEKPFALSERECSDLDALAREKRVRLGVGHNFLFQRGYEQLRADLRQGRFGPLDSVQVQWRLPLPQIKFGPFDNWMLQRPEHLILEIGPHLAAFMTDLVGAFDTLEASVDLPIELPGGQLAYRHWAVRGHAGRTAVSLDISLTPGEPVRLVSLRGQAACATHDFHRDRYVHHSTVASNTAVDNLMVGLGLAAQYAGSALSGFARSLHGTLTRSPGADPYRDSIARSVASFYRDLSSPVDARLSAEFGARVVGVCQRIAHAAGLDTEAPAPAQAAHAASPLAAIECDVLVVGGTGFIGRKLVRKLIEDGARVRVLSRNEAAARAEFGSSPIDVVQGHHGDPAVLRRALSGIKIVYHLAKATGHRWEDYLKNDVEPTLRLGEAASEARVERFIYTGTIDSYASADSRTVIDACTPVDPRIASRNLYARSKAACEAALERLQRERGLPLIILRPGIVIGEGAPPAHWGVGMFHSDTHVQLWGDGTNLLPFVTVEDVAAALALARKAPSVLGRTFVVTDRPLLSARDYVAAVEARSGCKIEMRPTPIWRHFANAVFKESIKTLVRHPNRRGCSWHDSACKSHRARYDNRAAIEKLGWSPAGTRESLIDRGVNASVDWYYR